MRERERVNIPGLEKKKMKGEESLGNVGVRERGEVGERKMKREKRDFSCQ